MKYLVTKTGFHAQIYAFYYTPGGSLFWTCNPKKAYEFNLTEARKVARAEEATVQPVRKEK